MIDKREERIRARARELWEEEGRPEGRHLDHWERAKAEIEKGIGMSGGTGASIPLGLGVTDIPKNKEGPALKTRTTRRKASA
jgi:hypothetical protein